MDGLLNLIRTHAREADCLEIRMDLLADPEKIDFRRISALDHPRLIFTNRMSEEGGGFQGDERDRIALLEKAIDAGADFIDIEFATRQDLRTKITERAHDQSTKVIISCHDFESTPDEKQLEELFISMADSGADIIKIVTMASDPMDFFNFAPVFRKSRITGIPAIAFCMGHEGKFSRVFSLSLGGFLTFASADSESETAPGQIPLGRMKKILSLLMEDQGS